MIRTRLTQPGRERRMRRRAGSEMVAAPRAAYGCDPAVERVREAGGPIDQASYTCGCGYLFKAAVSTSVVCPHCGTGQAW